jgi:hypothetical protein
MQIYLNETHNELNQLVQSLLQEGRINSQCNQLEAQNRIAHFESALLDMEEKMPFRWLWQWRPAKGVFECDKMGSRQSLQL